MTTTISINASKTTTWCNVLLAVINLMALLVSGQNIKQPDITSPSSQLDTNGDAPLELNNKHQSLRRDFRWPNRQLNVLIDSKSLNGSEVQILQNIFDQLELKTCLHVNKLPADKINPFDASRYLAESERNFIYVFKSQVGAYNRHPSLGLSSFGCTHQGRQSLVLTDLAFRWPELVLRYHIMRSLGLENLERPDGPVRKLLNILPLSQKISNGDQLDPNGLLPTFMVSSSPGAQNQSSQVMAKRLHLVLQGPPEQQVASYLSQDDLAKIKELYNCSDYQNKLSPRPMNAAEQMSAANDQLYSQTKSLLGGKLNAEAPKAADKPNDDQAKKLDEAEQSLDRIIEALEEGKKDQINDTMIDDAAKHIVDYLLAENDDNNQRASTNTTTTTASPPREQCSSMDTCPLGRSTDSTPASQMLQERPMLLKLDEFHAQDPHLQQANQMKLSQFSNDSLATYRLMGGEDNPQPQPTLQQQQLFQQASGQLPAPKSEMLISFEQSNNNNNNNQAGQNPIDTLASSQVLKLCSCTCQTMGPVKPTNNGNDQSTSPPPLGTTVGPPLPPLTFPPVTPPPTVYPTYPPVVYPTYPPVVYPTFPTYPTGYPYSPTPRPTFPTDTLDPNDYTVFPPTWPPDKNDTNLPLTSTDSSETTTSAPITTTMEPTTTTEIEQPPETTTTQLPPATTTTTQPTPTSPTNINSMISNACQQVEWVKPNKTVYASAKIVWDVDRGNQNYFLCQNSKDGELIPGKTHGFSCKVSSQGKAFEMHNFSVLIKPENVQLAWVQKSSNSFGKTNFPVIGGYSKTDTNGATQDPYIVSRCLVKDENNDVITLIGYVNNQGVGWFPFDDIQIECSQYDVLACVN